MRASQKKRKVRSREAREQNAELVSEPLKRRTFAKLAGRLAPVHAAAREFDMPTVRRASVCPHDCPSVCALDVEVIDGARIGRVHGADHPYTAGIVCAKVARYAERIHS